MIFDALAPSSLSSQAKAAIEESFTADRLACADISLWEVAMLIARRRIDPATDACEFIDDMIAARRIHVLPITSEIAVLSVSDLFVHADPADRLIAATAHRYGAALVTSDAKLRALQHISTIW